MNNFPSSFNKADSFGFIAPFDSFSMIETKNAVQTDKPKDLEYVPVKPKDPKTVFGWALKAFFD